ncbi:exopolyphosphatase [Nematocida parisii]|uniref:inorganic diphosphatase n=1 Tax=Nematocida parisii (strain ERTm3) TaxID=935791 RepID=I3EKI9_NEMP3|nr:uncharacterized protein NEPG_00727 [Nematocida parisii ERTm1]EIJ89736.1 hypothetical protein NEQG_00506 [Nematocida parisii ERTm3]KAI5145426.1 exopolyphosphatase [Nematocida parisii]EIJ94061.1 hypothetical protein NEPG_00727 [Nematocida parisii ERTm1]KAI5155260.1 exopolyphosphatase [Nematocida parisii]KAI5157986.1 exopolyphosphatase [Nematocida parisii]|eukprot:XP_013058557.1 hypothetical protein NEPG_00727 [Nematocida parisii ERTm1]
MDSYKTIVANSKFSEMITTAYSNLENQSIDIVLGNPSCDQDSFLGSHILAVMLGRIPVVNMQREIFECKHDLMKLCDILGIEIQNLVFLVYEENQWFLKRGDVRYRLSEKNVKAHLVDFNLPETSLIECKTFRVDRIIDHHQLIKYNKHVHSQTDGMEIELKAGSCCSLILRRINHLFADVLKEKKDTHDYDFLLLLSVPILTDTACLVRKQHDVDINGVNSALSIANVEFKTAESVMSDLKHLKHCEDKIPTKMILRMDYKSFDYPEKYGEKTYGISSVKYPYKKWIERDGPAVWKEEIKKFVEEKKHEIFIINCKHHNDRYLYVYCPSNMKDMIKTALFAGGTVESKTILNDEEIVIYQVDLATSRKIIAPAVFKYLDARKVE